METGLKKTRVISELLRSSHGKLDDYIPVGRQEVLEDPEFVAHMIAWNEKKGSIRDSKIALPIISLPEMCDKILIENSLAHLALQNPRMLVRALKFAEKMKISPRPVFEMLKRYIRAREENRGWWDRTTIQFRKDFKSLYAMGKVKPSEYAQRILFDRDYPEDSPFYAIAHLSAMDGIEISAAITKWKLPYLVISGALGKRVSQNSDMLYTILDAMTPTEVISHAAMLEKLGVKNFQATRALLSKKLESGATTQAAFKATRAASVQDSESVRAALQGVQERQISSLQGIEGDWLVLGDKSGSMDMAIEKARVIAATLARLVTGDVHLVWFDSDPRYMDVTGKTYDEILEMSSRVRASGQTSVGCGLQYLLDHSIMVDGIVIVSDAVENTYPTFSMVYPQYSEFAGKEVPVYLYHVGNSPESDMFMLHRCKNACVDVQVYDANHIDHYSLVNLVSTMKANRYGLIDEIYETPLLTLNDVFKGGTKNVVTA
jgi:hypothetical protein